MEKGPQFDQSIDKESKIFNLERKNTMLENELKQLRDSFDAKSVDMAFDYINDSDVGDVVDLWKKRIKKETDLLKQADDFGIKVFSEDIEHQDELSWQPGEIQIFFDPDPATPEDESWKNNQKYSVEGKPKYDGDLRLIGDGKSLYFYMKVKPQTAAITTRYSKYVQLFKTLKPSLRDQFHFFIKNGQPHPVVNAVIHELIHRSHEDKNPDIEIEITEAQAYANDIIDPLSDFESIDHLAEHIQQDYDVSQDKVKSAIENILFLYSQGYGTKNVAEMFTGFNPAIDGVWLLEEKIVKPLLSKKNISEEEKKLLVDNYILQRRIDVQKSRHSFFNTFGEWMKEEK